MENPQLKIFFSFYKRKKSIFTPDEKSLFAPE